MLKKIMLFGLLFASFSSSAGLISITQSTSGPRVNHGGGQAWTLIESDRGVANNGALYLTASSQSICSVDGDEESAHETNCRAQSGVFTTIEYDIAVNLTSEGISHFESLGQNLFDYSYTAILSGYANGYTEASSGGRLSNSGGSATWNGSLKQNGTTIVSASNQAETDQIKTISKTQSIYSTSILKFVFTANAATNARLGSGTHNAKANYHSFVYVDPVFNVDDSIVEFLNIEAFDIETNNFSDEAGIRPSSVSEPYSLIIFSLGIVLLLLAQKKSGCVTHLRNIISLN